MKKYNFMNAVALASVLSSSLVPGQAQAQPGIVPNTPAPLTISQLKAVIVDDLTILQGSGVDLSFARTVGQIIASADGPAANTAANRVKAVQTYIDTFKLNSFDNNGVTMPMLARPGEAALKATDLLSPANIHGMRPVAFTNRFDLAPADASTCGEYRITYAMGGPAAFNDRMTIIFEAAIPNPTPSIGIKGCLPLAKAWSAQQTLSGAALARSLEKIYFTGLPGFRPAVNFRNYGNPSGQVRADLFVKSPTFEWQLREFNVRNKAVNVAFVPHPVKDSVLATLYGDPVVGESAAIAQLRIDFQNQFITNAIPSLLAQDLNAKRTGKKLNQTTLFFKLATNPTSRFNGFTSVSSSGVDDPFSIASASLRTRIGSAIPTASLNWPITADQILRRQGTQSCGGCHEFSGFADVGPSTDPAGLGTIFWPLSNGFVHVDEFGNASQLLTLGVKDRFNALMTFINTSAPAVAPADMLMASTMGSSLSAVDILLARQDYSSAGEARLEKAIRTAQDQANAMPGAFLEMRPTH
jgi:hypothetical protein